jgi:hypothetical protein
VPGDCAPPPRTGQASNYSTSNQAVAALTAYGLADTVGKGDTRKVFVTEACERILRSAPDREQLLKVAALAPPIHKEVVDHFQGTLPHDDILKEYLKWERPESSRFTEDAVDAFIVRLRDTLKFAKLDGGDKFGEKNTAAPEQDTSKNGSGPEAPPKVVPVGSLIQWTSEGTDQFTEPRKVVGVDGDWAFVEGSPTGIPMSEVAVIEPPTQAAKPPVNPFYKQAGDAPLSETVPGGAYISFPLAGGNVLEIRLKKRVSRKDFERIKTLVDLSEASLIEGDE